MVAAYKTPPVFDIDNRPYSRWIAENKQGLAVALSLPENYSNGIRDKVFSDVTLDDLKGANGVTKLTTYMDKICKKDDLSAVYETVCDFDRFH